MPNVAGVSTLNNGWGICGFSSALTALYRVSGRGRQAAIHSGAGSPTRMLAEIKTFLQMLKADGDFITLGQIEQFTRSFGARYSAFRCFGERQGPDGFVERVDRIDRGIASPSTAQLGDFSIALPPNALVKYMRMMCGMPGAQDVSIATHADRYIVGVRRRGGRTSPYYGLVHWMYVSNNIVYSWGHAHASITAADPAYEMTHKILAV